MARWLSLHCVQLRSPSLISGAVGCIRCEMSKKWKCNFLSMQRPRQRRGQIIAQQGAPDPDRSEAPHGDEEVAAYSPTLLYQEPGIFQFHIQFR